jgi:hypothetical protein
MIFTLRELKEALDELNDDQLDQQAEIMISQGDHDQPFPLHPVIGFNTIQSYFTTESGEDGGDTTRSSIDNEHHPHHFVLLADYNMYSPDGTIGFDLETGERCYGKNQKKDVEVEDEFGNTFKQ